MALTIRLLGRPEIGGGPGLRGRKAWALLAYLLASESPPSRERLAGLLFEEADDPMRALRWNLSELRKALPGVEISNTDPLDLVLPPDAIVDVNVLRSGSWVEAIELEGIGSEFLEGVHLSNAPTMDEWLLNERRHLKAAAEAVLREAVMGMLGSERPDRAVDLARQLVALDPLEESYRALLIRSLKKDGRGQDAVEQADLYTRLLQRELGVAPGPAIAEAVLSEDAPPEAPVVVEPAAIQARIETGEAAVRAGQLDAGMTALKAAIAMAHAADAELLRARALLAAGTALVHTDRSNHEEGTALLHQAIAIAQRHPAPAVIAAAHRELAWVEFMAARYDRAKRWIYKAPAEALEDAGTRAGALWILGKCAAETGRYEESFELLDSAVAQARRAQDPMRLGFCLTALGRGRLVRRELDLAATFLNEAIEVIRFAGLVQLAALPGAFLGEVLLLQGDAEAAREVIAHSYAGAREIGDPTMESLAQRTSALLERAEGRGDAALEALMTTRARLIASPDHTWSQAYILDKLCEVAIEQDAPHAASLVDELANLAARTGMKEMLARAYLHRHGLGDAGALEAARLVAGEVDNPHLHGEVAAAEIARV